MPLETLFKDLASIFESDKEKETKDPNLLQGQKYLQYENQYVNLVAPHLGLIEQTTGPNLGSLREALESDDSTKKPNKSKLNSISDIEKDFNSTLAEYTSTYKLLSEELINKTQSQKSLNQFFGKVVTNDDGNYTYVNDFGFTHKYSNDAWTKNNSSCPSETVPITNDELSKLRDGPNMGAGQPCKVAGTNVQNSDTKEVAWIDINGNKHVYSDDVWKGKEASCDIPPSSLDNDSYNAIPDGSNMTTTTVCDQLDVNPNVWEKLSDLNNKLLGLAKQLGLKMENLVTEDGDLKEKVAKKKQQVHQYVGSLSEDRASLDRLDSRFSTVVGEKRDSRMVLTSRYYLYLVWAIVAIAVISITAHNMTSDTTSMAANILVGIFLATLVYMMFGWLIKKFT